MFPVVALYVSPAATSITHSFMSDGQRVCHHYQHMRIIIEFACLEHSYQNATFDYTFICQSQCL